MIKTCVRVGIYSQCEGRALALRVITKWRLKRYDGGMYLEAVKYGVCSHECARLARLEVENYDIKTKWTTSYWLDFPEGVLYE